MENAFLAARRLGSRLQDPGGHSECRGVSRFRLPASAPIMAHKNAPTEKDGILVVPAFRRVLALCGSAAAGGKGKVGGAGGGFGRVGLGTLRPSQAFPGEPCGDQTSASPTCQYAQTVAGISGVGGDVPAIPDRLVPVRSDRRRHFRSPFMLEKAGDCRERCQYAQTVAGISGRQPG